MLQKVKDWALMILLALVAVLGIILTGRKPEWVKEKEKKVEEREKTLKKAKKQEEKAENYYEELMQKHDDEIESVGKIPDSPDFDNPDDAADYLNDILSDAGSRTRRR